MEEGGDGIWGKRRVRGRKMANTVFVVKRQVLFLEQARKGGR